MKKSILSLFFALIGISSLTTSCEDMLTPDLDRYATEFTGKDTVNFYLGIVRNLQGMVEQNVLLGELRGDLVAPTEYVSDSINQIINFDYTNLEDGKSLLLNRAAYYKVINQCNFYLAKADSMAIKNNNYYMRRELAQVQLIRAWTYLQLVQNYGSVPFIVAPVDNSNTGWETNPPLGMVNNDNLLQKLEEHGGLKQAYAYSETLGYPSYGEFNNGVSKINHKYIIFNANLVYGDLYLHTAKTREDYERAAHYYHRYLDRDCVDYVAGTATAFRVQEGAEEKYHAATYDWLSGLSYGISSTPTSIRSMIPSASNSFFGQMLTRIPQIYGFDATSSNSSTTTIQKDQSGKEVNKTTTTGRINLVPNYRNRQVEPSLAYTNLSESQDFVYNEIDFSGKQTNIKYLPLGDQRMYAAAPLIQTEVGRLRFIQKFGASSSLLSSRSVGSVSTSFAFRYGIPLYTTRQVYLRYAEAINRAGFPRHAFAVIRDGLSPESLPTLESATVRDTIWKDPVKKDDIDSIYVITGLKAFNISEGANYISYAELSRAATKPFLNFKEFETKPNQGTRVVGTTANSLTTSYRMLRGYTDADSLFTYVRVVDARNAQEASRKRQPTPPSFFTEEEHKTGQEPVGFHYEKGEATEETVSFKNAEGGLVDDKCIVQKITATAILPPPASDDEIAIVETIIADELALETAFDGCRYYDLMRIARHRNAAGQDGNSWLAWLISRRSEDFKPYEQPTKVGRLFDFLKDEKNWYLPAPKND
ncbi:MAG: hypothetical protein Q4D66_02645 [Bacteroidales bacterium]|nr:hypothetical protein [Bacteroidales bacterium]